MVYGRYHRQGDFEIPSILSRLIEVLGHSFVLSHRRKGGGIARAHLAPLSLSRPYLNTLFVGTKGPPFPIVTTGDRGLLRGTANQEERED